MANQSKNRRINGGNRTKSAPEKFPFILTDKNESKNQILEGLFKVRNNSLNISLTLEYFGPTSSINMKKNQIAQCMQV